jgi:CBS domain-containing protein
MKTVRILLDHKNIERLITIDADAPVRKAIELLAENHIGALPVTREADLVGIVSERDYARKVVLKGRSSSETHVADIMSTPVLTVVPDDTVQHCMRVMTDKRVRHLPVVADGRLVGIISIGDCVRAVIEEYEREIDELKRYIAG